MASLPLSGTNIRLLSGVPFSNDYKHTRYFETKEAQTSYFLGKTVVHSMVEAKFQRIEGRNYIKVNQSIDDLWGTNYVMFQNASYNNKWFYGFVTKLVYINVGATEVHFELDVYQTWHFEVTFKPSFVVREHCPLWQSPGVPVINTVDEGLNYGTDYDIVDVQHYQPLLNVMFLVIVCKATLHQETGDPGANYIHATTNGVAQPLSYYIIPFTPDFELPINVTIDGATQEMQTITSVLTSIYKQTSAVNNIVSMYITPHMGKNYTYNASDYAIVLNPNYFKITIVEGSSMPIVYVKDIYGYDSTEFDCGGKYEGYNEVTESKLLMFPYTQTIIDDFKGNRTVLKNEYIDSTNLYVNMVGSMGISNKVAYVPRDYLTQSLTFFNDKLKVAIENAAVDNKPNDVAIINDMLAAFMQGNRNSLMNKADSIVFNGAADLIGGSIGTLGSAATGSVGGTVGSLTNTIKGAGNAVLQLQGLQAKVKDISNTPPSLQKMGSNTAFDYGNGYTGFYVIKKQIKPEYRKKLADFFKLYGYKINEVKIPNFHTRENWNYVQTASCTVLGSINNEDLEEYKAIFDNGITLWHTDDVGNYSLSNGVI